MSRGTILAHKHTLCEAFTGFFRALATERFAEVQHWLHPELEQLIRKQCERVGESAFLRNLRYGLGSATQRVRLGASQAEGARQIRTELLSPSGHQAGSVRFVLSPDGWRIYSLEVFKNGGQSPQAPRQAPPVQIARQEPEVQKAKKKSKLPKISPKKWFATIYASR